MPEAVAAFGLRVRLVTVADPSAFNLAGLLPRLARDLTCVVLAFGSKPADMSADDDFSATVISPDFLGACCCRNWRQIELDVA